MNRFSRIFAAGLLTLAGFSTAAAETFIGGRQDFRDETIYFAMTTRFYDGDPKNNVCGWDWQSVQIANGDPDWRGDFKGLIDKLDYIKALGFTAIWITPVVQNASGTDFHGYHAMDMSSVDIRYESHKSWGSSEDVTFQSLIDAAHAKGMKIILDIVLNHTGNFGEKKLNPLFTRSQKIQNQANVAAAVEPNYDRLPSNYNDLDGKGQYAARFKYFKNPQYDVHNYYHHYATGWNWDLPNRWWGQIAGDCVDLNTENNTVAEYLVDCYGKFIEMGVDGFRIDTTGHISRLTFNKQFIPQFHALAKKYESKRLNNCEFYMFGECCARFGEVIYRSQHNLSSHFYTWKSDQALLDQYDGSQAYWDTQKLAEGHDSPVGPMALCEKETAFDENSDNVFMKNGKWHQPDYSKASGFNVIDFPMHYNFNNAESAINIAKQGDHYYNDASYNVVYVDSHDYCPGPNDGTRFNGGTAQWAENLSLMFTFRGIPCIYYGSEVEFQKGCKVDAGGTAMPVKESGRAYFGNYIEGSVNTTDFGVYSNATGNMAKTLNADLAQHIIRLNLIRAAVPALRRGQYTFDDCTADGGYAFKRASEDSYALVALNGGATFKNCEPGTYVDLVTGTKYTATAANSTITVSAPKTQGQLRVLVKGWTGGKVGTDGKFIYATSPVAHGGSVSFTDPGTTEFYTAEDAIGNAAVSLSPAGGSFRTETLTVTARLNEEAASGWYQIGTGAKVTLTPGSPASFTIGKDMAYGQSTTVNWSATGAEGDTFTGSATYKKVDPNAAITVYVSAPSAPNIYAWGKNSAGTSVEPCGKWPGTKPSQSTEIDGTTYYYVSFDDMESVSLIFSNGNGGQTGDIADITQDAYFIYDGNSGYEEAQVSVTPVPVVRFTPNGGNFTNSIEVTATAYNSSSAWYKIGDGAQVTLSNESPATFTIGENMAEGESVTVSWSATGADETKAGSVTYTKIKESVSNGWTIYYDNSTTRWSPVNVHYWGDAEASSWPGVQMQQVTSSAYANLWMYVVPINTTGLVFNNGGSDQTNDITNVVDGMIYKGTGNKGFEEGGIFTGVSFVEADQDAPIEFFNLQGLKVTNPSAGVYLMRQGNVVKKVILD